MRTSVPEGAAGMPGAPWHRKAGGRCLLLALAFALGGCASLATLDNPFLGGRSKDPVKIHVTNLNFSDATLYAITPGSRQRLGVVTGKRDGTFSLNLSLPTELRLEIDLLAGDRCTTRRLFVDPGDQIQLLIDLDLRRSPLCSG